MVGAMRTRRRGSAAVVAAAGLLALLAPSGSTAAVGAPTNLLQHTRADPRETATSSKESHVTTTGGTWHLATPDTAKYNTITQISAVSRSDVWAVWNDTIEKWNGSQWRRVASPRAPVPTSVGDVVANGSGVWVEDDSARHSDFTYTRYVSHRVGSHWDTRRLDSRFAVDGTVHVLGPHNVWVLGSQQATKADPVGQPIAEHWNGQRWQTTTGLAAVPTGGTGGWATAAVAATGRKCLLHWNGHRWVVVNGPHITHPAGRPRYQAVQAGHGAVFLVVRFGTEGDDEDGGPGAMLFARTGGVWRERLFMPNEYTDALTVTSAPGVWLLSSKRQSPRLLHVVGSHVVALATPPGNYPNLPPGTPKHYDVFLFSISGARTSSTVFTGGTDLSKVLLARYLP